METKMIGNKIAEARKKMNISQAQLAEQLFISPQAVGKWERGESMPDIITLNRLAEILGVDLNYFSKSFESENDKTVFKGTDRLNDLEQMTQTQEDVNLSHSQERQLLTNFSGSNLIQSDFGDVTAHNSKFEGSALRGSNFSGADLTGSSFKASDVREANFDSTNLTDCRFYALDLSGASFHQSTLVRTNFNALGLAGVTFSNVKLTDVKMTATDLRKATFENCIFDGVDFDKCDLQGLCLDGQTLMGVKFDNSMLKDVTFKDATLRNVAFLATNALTNKLFRSLKTINFDGAMMDKLTYASLKGMGIDLSKVTII